MSILLSKGYFKNILNFGLGTGSSILAPKGRPPELRPEAKVFLIQVVKSKPREIRMNSSNWTRLVGSLFRADYIVGRSLEPELACYN